MYSRPAYNKYLIIATMQRQIINTAITANGMDIEFMRSTTKKKIFNDKACSTFGSWLDLLNLIDPFCV